MEMVGIKIIKTTKAIITRKDYHDRRKQRKRNKGDHIMSHFSVAVFHRADQSVESLLAPYDENIKVEPYIEYTKQQAIDFAREHYDDCKDLPDEKCWAIMADCKETDSDGNIYSTYNPDSKWDWWVVGGRFNKQLQVGKVLRDEAYVKDIDFSQEAETSKDALDFWDVLMDDKPRTPGKDYMTLFSKQYYDLHLV